MGFPSSSDGKASDCNAVDPGSIPGSGRSPGERNGTSLQYSCLENPMDRRAWQAVQSMWSQRVGHDWATNTQPKWTHAMSFNLFNISPFRVALQKISHNCGSTGHCSGFWIVTTSYSLQFDKFQSLVLSFTTKGTPAIYVKMILFFPTKCCLFARLCLTLLWPHGL